MNMINDGGPAFPTYASDHRGAACNTTFEPKGGATLRDYFAAKAMQGLLAAQVHGFNDRPAKGPFSSMAYEMADAMLKERLTAAQQAQPKRRPYNASGSLSEYGVLPECDAQQPADDEVVFIDGVGAARSSIKSCRDGVQWIRVGDRVYWPLSDSDAKRLHSACCGNGSFDGPASPLAKENVMNKSIPEAVVEAVARAICVACEERPDSQGDARGNEFRWQDYRDAALAAISALVTHQQGGAQ